MWHICSQKKIRQAYKKEQVFTAAYQKMTKEEPTSENTIIIGNKPEFVVDAKGNSIRTEPYLRGIISRLNEFDYVYIKSLPHPDKLAKISELYETLRWQGVKEIYGSRKFIYEDSTNSATEKIKVMLIKWEQIDRLKKYKQELLAEIKDEKND